MVTDILILPLQIIVKVSITSIKTQQTAQKLFIKPEPITIIYYRRQFMSTNTLAQQMQQINALQQRTYHYHSLYANALLRDMEENEFLDVTQQRFSSRSSSSIDCPNQEPENQTKRIKLGPSISGEDCILVPICQSQLLAVREEVNLSRIFQNIELFDHPPRQTNLQIQLTVDDNTPIQLSIQSHKRDNYSLSNFSSFNNNNQNDDSAIQFRQMIEQIQKRVGKTLSKRGIDKVIEQIRTYATELEREHLSRSNLLQKDSHNNFTHANSFASYQQQPLHRFDTMLNNRAFNRNKNAKHKQKQGQFSTLSILSDCNESQNSKQSELFLKTVNKQVDNIIKQEKENWQQPRMVLKNNVGVREMRVIRRSNPKPLMMSYSDYKQVDQFCVVNKIFGRDKDKIMRAAKSNKTCITLQ